jgi:hypothetical protein
MAADADDGSGDIGIPSPTATSHDDPMDDDAHEGEKNPFKSVLRVEYTIKRGTNNEIPAFRATFKVRSLVEAIFQIKNDITFKTKHGDDTFKTLDAFPKGDAFKSYFPMTLIDSTPHGPQKVVVEICIESPTIIDFHKTKEGTFTKYIEQNDIWLAEHKFETLKIIKIGWINQISTSLALQEDVANKLRERILEHEENRREKGSTEPTEPTPHFEIWPRYIKGSRVEGTNKARETRAYEVSCEAIHAETLRAKLMDSQSDDDQEAREGLFIAHGLRKAAKELHDANINSHNTYLDGLKKIEIFGIPREAMDTTTETLQGKSLRQHLMHHGTEDTNGPTFLTIEPTKETDDKGKWYLLYNDTKATEATTCVGQLIPYLRKQDPLLFPNPSIGGKRNAGFETYMTNLQKLTPDSSSSKSNGRLNRNNGNRNRNHNHRPSLTISYDEEDFPELSTTTTAPSSRPPSTPLTKLNSKTTPVNASGKKDTYASRTAATSSTKSNIKTNNKTSNAVSDKHRSDEATRIDALIERMAAQDTRMAKIECEHETRLAAIESKLIQQSATIARMELSTSKEIKALGALIETLTAEVIARGALVRPEPIPLNSKRGPESSPSPNGATKHPTKRKTCPDPIQLDGDFAKNDVYEAITEDDGDTQSMEDMEPVYSQSRSNSPGFESAIT